MSVQRLRPRWHHLALFAGLFSVLLVGHIERSGDTDGYENVGYWISHGRGIVTSKVNVPFQDACPEVSPGLRVFVYQPFGLPLFYALVGYPNTMPAHRVLHVVLFVLLSWLAFRQARRLLADDWLSALGALLIMVSPFVAAMTATATGDLFLLVSLLTTLELLIVSREQPAPARARWLLAAAVLCAIVSVAFRAAGIALIAAFAWLTLCDLRARRVRKAALDVLTYAPFLVFCVLFLYRNYRYSGSISGLCPSGDVSQCTAGFAGGAFYAGKNLLRAFLPDPLFNSPATIFGRMRATPLAWQPWANAAFYVLLAWAMVRVAATALRRRSVPLSPAAVDSPAGLFVVMSACYFVLLVVSLSHIGALGFELRYFLPLIGLGWPLLLSAARAARLRAVALAILALLLVGYAVDDAQLLADRRQEAAERARQPAWVGWIDRNTAPEATFLTDRNAVSARRPLRRVYWITTWHCGYALPAALRSEDGMAAFVSARRIDYVVFGKPGRGQAREKALANYGEFILTLMEGRDWREKIVYTDDDVVVYDTSSAQAPARAAVSSVVRSPPGL